MQAQVLLALVALLIVNTKQKYLDAVTNMYIEEATLSFTIDAPLFHLVTIFSLYITNQCYSVTLFLFKLNFTESINGKLLL